MERKNWWEPTEKEKIKKKIFIWWILLVVGIILTTFLWFEANRAELNYKKVQVFVVDSKKEITKSGVNYYVKVNHNREVKDLKNVINGYKFGKGNLVEVYETNGEVYANIEGVRSNTTISYIYFISLFITFGLLATAPTMTKVYFLKLKKLDENKNGEF